MSADLLTEFNPLVVKRSRRKTISLVIQPDGTLEIRCPSRLPRSQIEAFVRQKSDWIQRKRHDQHQSVLIPLPDPVMYRELATRTALLAEATMAQYPGLRPARVTVGLQRKRWGSCNSRGHIRLNACLALLPAPLAEYVIVHELCHLAHLNHSPDFQATVSRFLPDARTRQKALRAYRIVDPVQEGTGRHERTTD